MTDRTQEAQRLMGEIRYQVFRPEVTTVGECDRKCGNLARGSRVCADCLVEEMRKLMPEAETWRPTGEVTCWTSAGRSWATGRATWPAGCSPPGCATWAVGRCRVG